MRDGPAGSSDRRAAGRETIWCVTATILDGKATAAEIKDELRSRVKALAERGHHPRARHGPGRRRPRLAGVRQRQAPRLRRGRHRLDPPRPAGRRHPGQVERGRRRAERRPGLHRLHRPAAAAGGPGQQRVLELIDPDKDADGLHPVNLGRLVLGAPAPLPCTPRGIVELLRRLRRAAARRRGRGRRPRQHRRPPARPAAHPAQRERHGDPLPHRHPRPRRAHPRAPTSWSPRPACPACSPPTWSRRARPCSTSASPG